jgi:hypothetical protein
MPELLQPCFAAGEITPSLAARVDLALYQTALAECRNAFPRAYGSIINRPGTRYCGGTFDNGRVRLVPFIFSNADAFVMEFGHEYVRFWRDAGPLLYTSGPNDGDPVEVVTPYQVEDLPYLRFVQSGDVVTIVHGFGVYAAAELKRISNEDWTLTDITFGPAVRTPIVANITLAETNPTSGSVPYIYVFTYEDIGGQESLPTASKQVNNHNDGLSGTSYNTVTHTMPSDIAYLNIYRYRGGSYGWVGRTSGGSFKDDGINPNLADSPPAARDPFADDANPHSVTYFEQRLVFGGYEGAPDTLEMSKTGAYHDFTKSNPIRDDDAISATLASSQVNRIEHLINFNTLLIFTAGATWRLDRGQNGLTPQLEGGLRLQNATGTSSMVAPLLAGGSVLHIEAGERRVRDLVYDLNSDQFQGQERSLTAAHFFEGATIVAWCWSSAPHGLIWIVRDDGRVASLTYLREQQVYAWALHDFGGAVEDMVSIPEDGADTVYMVVRRIVGGEEVRYIERLQPRDPAPIEDSWFLDCAVAYDGAPVTSVTGLEHLEGQLVTLFLDGNPVQIQRTVVSGGLTLPYAASKVLVGLPYRSRVTTLALPPSGGRGGYNRGQMKAVRSVMAEIRYTRGLWAGPPDDMMELKQREFEAWGEPTQPATGPVELAVSSRWNLQGQVTIEQRDPLPFELLAIAPQFDIGG